MLCSRDVAPRRKKRTAQPNRCVETSKTRKSGGFSTAVMTLSGLLTSRAPKARPTRTLPRRGRRPPEASRAVPGTPRNHSAAKNGTKGCPPRATPPQVYTRVYTTSRHHTHTSITLKKLNNDQIDEYLKAAGKQILSSVGCYQAEKLGPQIIKSIKGDFFNVLGFPLFPFLSFLSNKEK